MRSQSVFAWAISFWLHPFSCANVTPTQIHSCRADQIKATFVGRGTGMGSNYTGVVFVNRSTISCTLQSNIDFEQFDSQGSRMPLKVTNNADVNGYGKGCLQVVLGPKRRVEITVKTVNRTGYDESRRCAVEMRVSQVIGPEKLRCLPIRRSHASLKSGSLDIMR